MDAAVPLPAPDGDEVAEKRVSRLDDFHLTPAEAQYLRSLPRQRRLAITAAFRRRNFKERAAVVGRLKAEFKQVQARMAELARFRHSITEPK